MYSVEGEREARHVVNEVFRLDAEGYDWDEIEERVVELLITQRARPSVSLRKQLTPERYYDDDDEYGRPQPRYEDLLPIRMNHGEGYALTQIEDTGEIKFRITAKRYSYVRGTLQGNPRHLGATLRRSRSSATPTKRVGYEVLVCEIPHKPNAPVLPREKQFTEPEQRPKDDCHR